MDNSSNTLFSRLAKLGKKKPQPLTDLSEVYAKIANESIYFLKLEERRHYKQAIQGWKAMCTSVMFQLTMVERQYPNLSKYSEEEIDVRDGITELYQKGLVNLERVKKLYEEYGDGVQEDNLTFTDVTQRTRINSPMKPIANNFAPAKNGSNGRLKFTSLRDQGIQRKDNNGNNSINYNKGGNVFDPLGNKNLKQTDSIESDKPTKVYFATSKPLGKPKLNDQKSAVADYFDDFDDVGVNDDYEDNVENMTNIRSDKVAKEELPKPKAHMETSQSTKALNDIVRMNRRISKRLTIAPPVDDDFTFDVDDYFADDYSEESDLDANDELKARSDALDALSGKYDAVSSISATSLSSNTSSFKIPVDTVEIPATAPPLPPLPSLNTASEKDIWSTPKPYLSNNHGSAPALYPDVNSRNEDSCKNDKCDSLATTHHKKTMKVASKNSKPVKKKEPRQERPQIKIENYLENAQSQKISAEAVAKLVYTKNATASQANPKTSNGMRTTIRPNKPIVKNLRPGASKVVPTVKKAAKPKSNDEQKNSSIYKTKTLNKSAPAVSSRITAISTDKKPVGKKPKRLVKQPPLAKTSTTKMTSTTNKVKDLTTPKSVPKSGVTSAKSAPETKRSTPDEDIEDVVDEKKMKADLEDEIIDSLPGVDKTAAKQIFSEIVVHGDEVHWEDIAGLENAKFSLKEAVVYPFLRPDLFLGLREPVRGMLLFGPPGTGKTMLARAVATESHSTFFSISASSLTSKYLGESEKLVRALFAIAKKLSPSIIFVDEIDSIMGSRNSDGENESSRRIKNEFLIQWSSLSSAAAGNAREDGDDGRVLVLAATNLPWSIDEAARRRFVRRQYIPLPEPTTREVQLKKLLSHQKHNMSDDDFQELLKLTEGYSGSDITSLAKDAAMGPLRELGDKLLETTRESIRSIELIDFKNSLEYIKPSVSQEGLAKYEEWAAKFGSSGV